MFNHRQCTVVIAIQKSIGMAIKTPCRIATPQNFILKFGTRDYVRDIPNMQILRQIGSAEILPKYVKYNTFVTVLIFFSILSAGQTAALAHTLNGSNDVFPRFVVRMKGGGIWGKYAPRKWV